MRIRFISADEDRQRKRDPIIGNVNASNIKSDFCRVTVIVRFCLIRFFSSKMLIENVADVIASVDFTRRVVSISHSTVTPASLERGACYCYFGI